MGVDDAIAAAHDQEWARIVATLIRVTGDWSLAEDAAQDAFASAVERWPREGVPRRPGAWLTTVARNRAIDRLRRARTESARLAGAAHELAGRLAAPQPGPDADPALLGGPALGDGTAGPAMDDDRLRLVFTCCHPALPLEARVALTLRTVAGLTTPEIARAFLVPEPTMAQRIVRAKRKIAHAGIPYRVPPAHLLPERLPGVLAVLYLLFNEGYSVSSGDQPLREGLAGEAVRLSALVADLLPDQPEAHGLAALLRLQHARRDARLDGAGDLVTLEDQDRSRWHRDEIADGLDRLRRASELLAPNAPAGRYTLQAWIAACHATAASAEETDVDRIVDLYEALAELDPSPVVALNRAVAIGLARGPGRGPAAGLAALARLDDAGRLRGYALLPAAQADLLRRAGRLSEAAERYRAALELAPPEAQRRYLERRSAQVEAAVANAAPRSR